MKTIILASNNKHKLEEFRQLFAGLAVEVKSLEDMGFHEEIEETGVTFEENAAIKCNTVAARFPGCYVLADDSGLCVDRLNGAPGVYSARYGGEKATYAEKFRLLHEALAPWPEKEWTAAFVCVLGLVCPDGRHLVFEGRFEGLIAREPAGPNGFGYDPIFYLPEWKKTAAELSPEEKNSVSHRGRAVEKLLTWLEESGEFRS